MPEKFEPPKPEQKEKKPMPATLDVIKINGRWAQVKGGDYEKCFIIYLDDKSFEYIDLRDYEFSPLEATSVEDLLDMREDEFTDREFENVHFSHETKTHYPAKMLVNVFGEFIKKGD